MNVSRQSMVAASTLLLGCAIAGIGIADWRDRYVDVGLWFDAISYGADEAMVTRLGGPMTADELNVVRRVGHSEVARAFAPLRVVVSDDRRATYHVRVVQDGRIPGSKYPAPAGHSRGLPGLGGDGVVNFRMIVSNALAFAPPDSGRDALIRGIGLGVGRAAVHELAHQLLGSTPVDDARDIGSYEYRSSFRREQYYGEMHWGIAWPVLRDRIGLK